MGWVLGAAGEEEDVAGGGGVVVGVGVEGGVEGVGGVWGEGVDGEGVGVALGFLAGEAFVVVGGDLFAVFEEGDAIDL